MRDGWSRVRPFLLPLVLALVLGAGLLVTSVPPADRVETLAGQLRCPVCQGESVAQSRSDTADAIRQRIIELVDDGRSDEEIRQYFVARYGEWIVLDPAFSGRSFTLWLLPPLGLLLVLAGLRLWRRRAAAVTPLSESERERVEGLIADWRRQERP